MYAYLSYLLKIRFPKIQKIPYRVRIGSYIICCFYLTINLEKCIERNTAFFDGAISINLICPVAREFDA